jgi:3-hydroxyacyl-CoA dehydrogenase
MSEPTSLSLPVRVQRADGIAVVTIDNPPVNALSQAVRSELLRVFRSLVDESDARGIVLIGAGRDFVAGADIREMDMAPLEPSLPQVILAMEACRQPIVAAISGNALGGGFELALACDRRLAAEGATVGLPEVKLGIIPGAGGTQRLPRLVGVARAIALIASGRRVPAKEAAALGLVDRVVEGDLLAAARAEVAQANKRRLSEAAVPAGDDAEIEKAAAEALRGARGVPAVGKAIELVRLAAGSLPFDKVVRTERATFVTLRDSAEAKALRHLFFAERNAQKVPGVAGAKARRIERVAVIGGGTMGSGITVALADAGLSVVLVERDDAALAAVRKRIGATYDRVVAGGRLSRAAADERISRIALGTEWAAIAEADLVIEAVFEEMDVKLEVFRRLDELARPGTVLATNTSYLDVNRIAQATRRPQDVVGCTSSARRTSCGCWRSCAGRRRRRTCWRPASRWRASSARWQWWRACARASSATASSRPTARRWNTWWRTAPGPRTWTARSRPMGSRWGRSRCSTSPGSTSPGPGASGAPPPATRASATSPWPTGCARWGASAARPGAAGISTPRAPRSRCPIRRCAR